MRFHQAICENSSSALICFLNHSPAIGWPSRLVIKISKLEIPLILVNVCPMVSEEIKAILINSRLF